MESEAEETGAEGKGTKYNKKNAPALNNKGNMPAGELKENVGADAGSKPSVTASASQKCSNQTNGAISLWSLVHGPIIHSLANLLGTVC